MNRRNPAFLALLALWCLVSAAQAQDNAVSIGVDPVLNEPVSETAAVIGRFVSRQAGPVAAQSEGSVADVLVEVGDRVEAGQIMVVLNTQRLELQRDIWVAEVRSAEAFLGVARAELALAQQELERMESLTESAAFSQARYEDSQQMVAIGEAGVAAARAGLLSAQANLALAEDELADATIGAPYDAVVTLRMTEVGAYIDVGDPVVTLMNDAWIEIEADVPSARIGALAEGTVVQLSLEDGTQQEAFVRAVGVSEDPQARTRPVRFTPAWAVEPGTLAQGQSAILRIPAGPQTDVITVHKDAVIRSGGYVTVFVVVEDEDAEREEGEAPVMKAEERNVELGAGLGNRFIVLSGLQAGELAIIKGNEALDDGAVVAVVP